MIRLHIIAEGQTEQSFVNKMLRSHLGNYQIFTDVRCVLTSKDKRAAKEYRGGITKYVRAKNDIQAWLKEDKDPKCRFTTMFDLYRLPDDFPGYSEAKRASDPYERVRILEDALREDINSHRFLPYIQLHEFEALILAEPQKLSLEYLEHDKPISRLISMMKNKNPELINDGPQTAPSKRIEKEIPEYKKNKVNAGVAVVEGIGLPILRGKCTHFNSWLTRLEELAENAR